MNGITFSGLSSGLDTQAIIEQLMALERLPIQQLEARRDQQKEKVDLLGTLKGLVNGLRDKAESLSTRSNFFKNTVGPGAEGVATISASSEAQAGTHTIEVLATAATDRWAFDAVTDPDANLTGSSNRRVEFTVDGTQYKVFVDQAESSLNQIASKINDEASAGVTATVVNVSTESNPRYQLVLTSTGSGEEHRITGINSTIQGLSIDYDPPGGDDLPDSVNNITVGTNALARIDGLLIERTDNDFSDVLAGVSIDVLAASGVTSFTVEPDREAITGQVQEFVDSYNEVIDFINEQSSYSEEGGAGGGLFGDSALSAVRRNVRTALFNVNPGAVAPEAEAFSTLSLLGIKQDNDGRLSIDSTIFEAKMAEDIELVADLFVDLDGFENMGAEPNTPDFYLDQTEDSGLAATLMRSLDQLLKSSDGPIIDPMTGERLVLQGLFDAKDDTLSDTIKRFDDQIEAKERRLEFVEQNLIRRFAVLEEVMGRLQAQGAALNSLFGTGN